MSDSESPQLEKLAPDEPRSHKKELKDPIKTVEVLPKAINLNIIREKRPRLVIDHMVL